MPPANKIPSYKITEIKKEAFAERDFELYQFAYFAKNIDHLQHLHRHDHFALFFVSSGQGSHIIDFNEHKLKAKRVFLIAPGQIHAWKSIQNIQGMVLLFTRDFFTITLQYQELRSYLFDNIVSERPYIDLSETSYRHLISVFENMEAENLQGRKYGQNIIRSYVNIILFELSRIYEQSSPLTTSQDRAYATVKVLLTCTLKPCKRCVIMLIGCT